MYVGILGMVLSSVQQEMTGLFEYGNIEFHKSNILNEKTAPEVVSTVINFCFVYVA